MEALLGKTLLTPDLRPVATADALRSKDYVCLYFSAHWCAPCRNFTPLLKAAYERLRALNVEVVFVSSDRDEVRFGEYFGEMPWLALPYADRERKTNLASRYRVATIPRLIVLDGESRLITLHGRTDLVLDPALDAFPWRLRPVKEVLRHARLLDPHMQQTFLQGGIRTIVLLYFTCLRTFVDLAKPLTARLQMLYHVLREHGRAFEIVWVSLDTEQKGYDAQRAAMPWLALPFSDPNAAELVKLFDVRDTPAAAVVEYPSGTVLTHLHAIEAILNDDTGKAFPWAHPPAVRLNAVNADVLNRSLAVVFVLPAADASSDGRSQAGSSRTHRATLVLSPEDAKAVSAFEAVALARTDVAYRPGTLPIVESSSSELAATAIATDEDGPDDGAAVAAESSSSSGGGRRVVDCTRSLSPSSSLASLTLGGGAGSSAAEAAPMAAGRPASGVLELPCGNDSRTGSAPPPAFLYGVPDVVTMQVLSWARIIEPPPLVCLIDFPTKTKYMWPLNSTSELTVESLSEFLCRYEDGRLRPQVLR